MEMVIGVLHSIKHNVFIIPFRTNETVGVRGGEYTQLLNMLFSARVLNGLTQTLMATPLFFYPLVCQINTTQLLQKGGAIV